MEGNECAAAVRRRELLPVVDGEVVGRPVRGKRGDGRSLAGARPDRRAAVAAIFRRQDELPLAQIEVAIRPAKVGAAFQLDELFRRLVFALLGGVERAPVLAQLVPPVLGRENPAGGIECDSFAVAQPGGKALGGGELLAGAVGVIAPDTGPRLELRARLDAGGVGNSVLPLAGIGGRAEVDVQGALRIDLERMHGMVAGERQPRHDDLGRAGRRDRARRQGVADDAVVGFREQRAVINCDSRPAGIAALDSRAEANHLVGTAAAGRVLQRQQEAPVGRLSVLGVGVIAAATGVDVDHAVRRNDHVPGVADIVGEHGGAEPGRQRNPAIVTRAGAPGVGSRVARILRGGWLNAHQQHACDRQRHRGKPHRRCSGRCIRSHDIRLRLTRS